VDERAARLLEEHVEARERLARVGRLEIHRGAVAARRGHFRLARSAPHHDERVDPLLGRSPGRRLRVIAGRDGDDSPRFLVRGQRCKLGEDSARLEGARALEELRLQEHVRPERAARDERRAQESAADDVRRALHVRPLDHRPIVDRNLRDARPVGRP
jgi:hypothetical protein